MRTFFTVSALLLAGVFAQSDSSVASSGAGASATAASASASSSASAPSASASSALLSALQSNPSTSAFATALANVNPALGVQSALNDPSRNLTILAPPSYFLSALSQVTFLSSTTVALNSTNVTLIDALLAYHVINGSYPAASIAQELMNGQNGFQLGTLLAGFNVDIYGFIASQSTGAGMPASASGSASASASASASSSSGSLSSQFFVNNALIITGNAIQSGGSYVHLLDRPLDPLFPLVGVAEIPTSGGQDLVPSAIAFASTITVSNVAVSSAASATATGSASGSGSATPLGPIGPSSLPSSSSSPRYRGRWA